MNSSPPLILQKVQGYCGIWASGKFGKFQEDSGELRGIQWGFAWRLVYMNSVGIPGGFRGNAGFSGKSGLWGGFG